MMESGYYPPGAEFDPNAPWNQVDPDYSYLEEPAMKVIDEEIECLSTLFEEYIIDVCDLSLEPDSEDIVDWYNEQTKEKQNELNEGYRNARLEDVCYELACSGDYDEPDYDMRDYILDR